MRTKERRNNETFLLLGLVKPHKPVKSCTIARWMVEILSLAGIDTSTFKAHSTRSASSSKAMCQGVPLDEIVKRGHWSSATTFEKFYCKDIQSEGSSVYESSVLSFEQRS